MTEWTPSERTGTSCTDDVYTTPNGVYASSQGWEDEPYEPASDERDEATWLRWLFVVVMLPAVEALRRTVYRLQQRRPAPVALAVVRVYATGQPGTIASNVVALK